jgi:CspA family cold shock protein
MRQTPLVFLKVVVMPEGTIKKLADKGFGFIDTGSNKDLFFHMSNLDGVRFEELREGQRVEFTHGDGPKGPVAQNVRLV